jgi:hypothetical protein
MSSVTVDHSCSCERWFGMEAGIGQATRSVAAVAEASEVDGAPGALRIPREPWSRSRAAAGRIELGQGVTDDPRPVAVVGPAHGEVVSCSSAADGSRLVDLGQRAIRPRQRLLDVRGGTLAHELPRGAGHRPARPGAARGVRAWVIVAIVEPMSRRSHGEGENTSCSSSAQR